MRITPDEPTEKIEIDNIKDTNYVMENLIPNSSYEVNLDYALSKKITSFK